MRKEDVRYWDAIAAQDDAAVRDALAGLRSERAFDESGRVDASHFVLPFGDAHVVGSEKDPFARRRPTL